jgi:hypothetical protein
MRLIFQCSVVLLAIGAVTSNASAQQVAPADSLSFGYDTHKDFIAFDSNYPKVHDALSTELDALQADLIRQQRAGRKTYCSRQIFLECRWLVYSTCRYAEARKRLNDLREMLAAKSDPHGREQAESDGSFASCCNAWWLRMDLSCDELIVLAQRWEEPKYPLKLLTSINSPDKLRSYLDSLLISDIRKTGLNNSRELNMATADLERFIVWDGTWKELPTKFQFDPGLKSALLDYEDNKWQDPNTGMWGAWFRAADGTIVKTSDLTITFHIVSFRDADEIKRWPRLIDTTLAMKNGRYPYGWLEEGRFMSNHHNMDVVTMWRLGWSRASSQQRGRISQSIAAMLDFCLTKSLQEDGSFKSPEEDTLSSSFYFGVGFLHEIGFFSKRQRFWTDREFPQAKEIRQRILNRIKSIGLDDPEAFWAASLLGIDSD